MKARLQQTLVSGRIILGMFMQVVSDGQAGAPSAPAYVTAGQMSGWDTIDNRPPAVSRHYCERLSLGRLLRGSRQVD